MTLYRNFRVRRWIKFQNDAIEMSGIIIRRNKIVGNSVCFRRKVFGTKKS